MANNTKINQMQVLIQRMGHVNTQERQTHIMKKINKALIIKRINLYLLAQKYRNNVFHNGAKHKTFIYNQHKAVVEKIKNGSKPHIKRHA